MEPSERFLALMAGDEEALELEEAALELAGLDHRVDRGAVIRQLDEWAEEVRRRLPPSAGGAQYLSVVHQVLFDEAGLRGDTENYYSPANSCLDLVVARRKGLPITLSVIYLEVARRLLRPVYGVGLPSHFVCEYNDGLVRVYVDVFDGGRLLTEDDCLELIRERTGRQFEASALLFSPSPRAQIVTRMLNNLQGSYRRLGEIEKADAAGRWLRLGLGDI